MVQVHAMQGRQGQALASMQYRYAVQLPEAICCTSMVLQEKPCITAFLTMEAPIPIHRQSDLKSSNAPPNQHYHAWRALYMQAGYAHMENVRLWAQGGAQGNTIMARDTSQSTCMVQGQSSSPEAPLIMMMVSCCRKCTSCC